MGLTIRDEKGSALEHAEMDANWRFLRDRIDALEALYNLSWNNDGTLKISTVNGAALQNRIVSTNKRTFPSNFWYDAAGTANALTITNPGVGLAIGPLASKQGTVFYIKTGAAANTGPVTLAVDAEPATAVNKAVGVPLVAGDIQANSFIEVYLDVVAAVPTFYLMRTVPTIAPLISGIDFQSGAILTTSLTSSKQKVGTVNLTKPTGTFWKHVRVNFSYILSEGVNSGVSGFELRIGSDVIVYMQAVGTAERPSSGTGAMTIILEGLPNGTSVHTSEDVIAIDAYMRTATTAPYDTVGDTPERRQMVGVGYYGP